MYYKKIDLFGNEERVLIESKKKSPQLSMEDYEGFVEKFKPKKTTDDCYTPSKVYDVILNFVDINCNLSRKEIIRPFFPECDYESIEYNSNFVVIDNPPFQ